MKKTNFFKNTMMLIGTSLLLVTTLTSCSEKEETATLEPGIETNGIQKVPGPGGFEYVNEGQWTFINGKSYIYSPGGCVGMVTNYVDCYITLPKDDFKTNAFNVKLLINNSTIIECKNIAIEAEIAPAKYPNSTFAKWYDQRAKIAHINIMEPRINLSIPVGVFVERATI